MKMLKFSYPSGYAAKFGVGVTPRDAIYPADLYPKETLDQFRAQGVIITPVDETQDSSTDTRPVGDVASSPAPPTPGAGENNKGYMADDEPEADPAPPQTSPAKTAKKAGGK